MSGMRIGFLGFGEAARAFRASLAGVHPSARFVAYDIKLAGDQGAAMRAAMAAAGVVVAETPAELPQALGGVDWLFSAVTADQSLLAIRPLLPALGAGPLVFDINSVSPGRKRETDALVRATGAGYADMAVMAPALPDGHTTPVLLAGPGGFAEFLDASGFNWRLAGPEIGQATAIKMCRSVFVKGLEAITVQALMAAERAGCREEILASLGGSFPGLGWPDFAAYMFERTLVHGARRAAEMRESAATLAELGLSSAIAEATAAVQELQGQAGAGCVDANDLPRTIRAALAAQIARG